MIRWKDGVTPQKSRCKRKKKLTGGRRTERIDQKQLQNANRCYGDQQKLRVTTTSTVIIPVEKTVPGMRNWDGVVQAMYPLEVAMLGIQLPRD